MKKIIISLFLLSSFFMFSQENNKYPQDIDKKTEIKLNTFSLIGFASLDVSYERLLNKDTSFGVSVFFNTNDSQSDTYFPKKFSITPYYRWFFSETRFARGFFVEGFASLNNYEEELFSFFESEINSQTDFALGVSVGGKFVIKSGFTAEVFFGVGRNLVNSENEYSIISRGGVSLGYRF